MYQRWGLNQGPVLLGSLLLSHRFAHQSLVRVPPCSSPMWDKDRTTILRSALQLALELEITSCVDVAIRLRAPVGEINLLQVDTYLLTY